jgi:hypothetical protein
MGRSLGREKIDLFRFPNKQTGGAEIPSTKHTNPSDLVSQLEMILARPPKAQKHVLPILDSADRTA